MKPLWTVLAALLCASPAARAQQGALTPDNVTSLVRSDVRDARILQLARERCLSFRVDAWEDALRRGGASSSLVNGLRNACVRLPAPPPPAPAPPPPPPPATGGRRAPVATTVTDLPQINANVELIQFWEGGSGSLSQSQRSFQYRFLQGTARFINYQIKLSYPAPGRQLNFLFEVVIYRPDGRELSRDSLTSRIEPYARTSTHAYGRGWETPGQWSTGVYRLEVLSSGTRVASATFEIVPPAAPVYDVPALAAKVTQVRFFAGGTELPSLDQEPFAYRFPRSSTRYIYYRLDLAHSRQSRTVDIPILMIIYRPDGTEYGRMTTNHQVQGSWEGSVCRAAFVYTAAGMWPVGTYRVEFFQAGQRIATGSFDIY